MLMTITVIVKMESSIESNIGYEYYFFDDIRIIFTLI